MKKVCVRDKVCDTCPWRAKNQDQLIIEQTQQLYKDSAISPCHQELEAVTGSKFEGVEKYAAKVDEFQVCRGFVIAKFKYKALGVNRIWEKLNLEYAMSDKSSDPDLVELEEVLNGNIGH